MAGRSPSSFIYYPSFAIEFDKYAMLWLLFRIGLCIDAVERRCCVSAYVWYGSCAATIPWTSAVPTANPIWLWRWLCNARDRACSQMSLSVRHEIIEWNRRCIVLLRLLWFIFLGIQFILGAARYIRWMSTQSIRRSTLNLCSTEEYRDGRAANSFHI